MNHTCPRCNTEFKTFDWKIYKLYMCPECGHESCRQFTPIQEVKNPSVYLLEDGRDAVEIRMPLQEAKALYKKLFGTLYGLAFYEAESDAAEVVTAYHYGNPWIQTKLKYMLRRC